MSIKHLYVHIPFCRSRCAYCDFVSEPVGPHARAGRVERYLTALGAELGNHVGGVLKPGEVETIYVGGGTPTVLPGESLVALVHDLAALQHGRGAEDRRTAEAGIRARASTGSAAEVETATARAPAHELTLESNPGTVDAGLLERLMAAGVTRLSLGVQSFSPALRRVLGRKVTQKEIEGALAAVAATGWQEWNIDLVFGIPGQSWQDAAADVEAAVTAGPTHISLYDLTYTDMFEARVEAALGAQARHAAAAFAEGHFAEIVARLQAAGYRRYEVSNFALPAHECRHNQAYWRGDDYLGIGTAAVSTAGGRRRTNPRSVGGYLAGEPPEIEMLSPRTRLWEQAMLGLRTSEGLEESRFVPVIDREARDRLLAQGCLEMHCGKLRLNPGFLDLSNSVISALLVVPEEP